MIRAWLSENKLQALPGYTSFVDMLVMSRPTGKYLRAIPFPDFLHDRNSAVPAPASQSHAPDVCSNLPICVKIDSDDSRRQGLWYDEIRFSLTVSAHS